MLENDKVIKSDSLGTVYMLPKTQLNKFIDMDEEVQNVEFASNEWHDAMSDLNNEFGEFEIS